MGNGITSGIIRELIVPCGTLSPRQKLMRSRPMWHHAFVFNPDDYTCSVFEVYSGLVARTSIPVLTFLAESRDEAINVLEMMITDLQRSDTCFESLEDLDSFYNIVGPEDVEETPSAGD